MCASWRETAPGKVLCANWSVQVGLRKLLYASCTVQVALRKLLRASCPGKLVPASWSLHVALCELQYVQVGARQHQARCSAQTGRCKLVCASCSTQVALCKLLCASCSAQVAPASWSLQVALCKLRSLQVALCKLLCASCSVQVALRKLLCASCSRQGALRKLVGASWSAQVALCNLLCASCSAQVAVKCKLHLATPARGPGRNRTHDPPETTPEDQFEQQKSQKTLSFCTSTTPIPAEGCASTAEIAKNHGFLHVDHADPRRGSREQRRNPQKPWVFAPRPRRSPQRVARAG